MLSVPVAPVSWRHAYAFALLGLACLWRRELSAGKINARTLLLAFCTVAITSYLNQWAIEYLMRVHMQGLAALITLLLPGLVVLVVLRSLLQMRSAVMTSAS